MATRPPKGICTGCQEQQSIRRSSTPRQEEKERGMEDCEIDQTYGDTINFVVEPHDFHGEPCDGSGQIPQALVP